MAIKKCRKKVDCMTDEMKMFQRITTEDAMLKQVNNRLNPANLYTWKKINELKNKKKKFAIETLSFLIYIYIFFSVVSDTVIKTASRKCLLLKKGKGRNKTAILPYQCAFIQSKRSYMSIYMPVGY